MTMWWWGHYSGSFWSSFQDQQSASTFWQKVHEQSKLFNPYCRDSSGNLGFQKIVHLCSCRETRKEWSGSGYFSRTWFKCSHMVVKTSLYCTRKCGCKCSVMSACGRLQPPCNGSTGQVPLMELLKTIAIHRNTHVHLLARRIPSQEISWLGMRLARRWTCVFLWIAIVFRSSVRGTWPVEPLHGGCSRLQADMTEHLQPHFLVQYNGVFTTMWLHLNHVLEK